MKNILKISILQVTKDCNQNCIYCCRDRNIKSLSLEQISEKITSLNNDFYQVIITGGEPTVREDLLEIIKICKNKVKHVHLQSNGLNLIDPLLCKKLVDSGLSSILIALPSLDEKKCKEITGVKEAFAKKVISLKNLNSHKNLDVGVVFVISKLNFKELPDYVRFVHSISDRIYIQISYMIKFHNPDCNFKDYVVRYPGLEPYLYSALKYCKENSIQVRIDGIPLCYLNGFFDYVSDSLEREYNFTEDFIESKRKIYSDKEYEGKEHIKTDKCNNCVLFKNCKGLYEFYFNLFGDSDLKPKKESRLNHNKIKTMPITSYCNNNCVSCFEKKKNLEFKDYETVIKEIKNSEDSISEIEFRGCECTIHPDFLKIIRYLKKKNYKYHLKSNLRMLSYIKFARKIASPHLMTVNTTLHGPNKEVHDSITLSKGSFNQTLRGIHNLKELGFNNIHVNMAINKLNYESIIPVFNLLNKIGITHIRYSFLRPENNAYKNINKIYVHPRLIKKELIQLIPLTNKNIHISVEWAPLCLLPEQPDWIIKYTDKKTRFVGGYNADIDLCSGCKDEDNCIGIHENYIKKGFLREFTEMKNELD